MPLANRGRSVQLLAFELSRTWARGPLQDGARDCAASRSGNLKLLEFASISDQGLYRTKSVHDDVEHEVLVCACFPPSASGWSQLNLAHSVVGCDACGEIAGRHPPVDAGPAFRSRKPVCAM